MRVIAALVLGTAIAVGLETASLGPAAAGSVEVAPTTIDLPPGSDTAVFYITNRGDHPIVAQIQGMDWRQTDKGDQLDPSGLLTISPPMARLAPGQQQIVRLAAKPDASTTDERAFRLLVSELPDPAARAGGGVRVLLQFSVPVFEAAAHPVQAHLGWQVARSADGFSLVARNTGARHVKLTELSVATADGRSVAIAANAFVYILPGASHRWTIPVRDPRTGEALHIIGRDANTGIAIDASSAVAP
jgi:fimbrial chaperone protein